MAIQSTIGQLPNPVFAGEDVVITFTITSTDITGWALSFVAGAVTKTVGSGITITDGANGVCTVDLAAADTTALGAGDTSFKLRRTDSGSNTVLSFGTLRITA